MECEAQFECALRSVRQVSGRTIRTLVYTYAQVRNNLKRINPYLVSLDISIRLNY